MKTESNCYNSGPRYLQKRKPKVRFNTHATISSLDLIGKNFILFFPPYGDNLIPEFFFNSSETNLEWNQPRVKPTSSETNSTVIKVVEFPPGHTFFICRPAAAGTPVVLYGTYGTCTGNTAVPGIHAAPTLPVRYSLIRRITFGNAGIMLEWRTANNVQCSMRVWVKHEELSTHKI